MRQDLDNDVLLLSALIKKVEDEIEKLSNASQLRGLRGHQGPPGNDGKDFNIEEHRDTLRAWAKEFAIKFEDFTAKQIDLLRGEKGEAGRNGKDGKDGKDFSLEDNKKYLEALAQRFAVKFEDFTEEQILQLRGPKGDRGKNGKDFSWEESHEIVKKICTDIVDSCTETLKLKFSDLTSEEIEELRGPKGRDGRDGKDFVFEDHKEFFEGLKLKFSDLTPENIENLKLHFSHLTLEEKKSLKLKFTDLTEEDISLLRGPRGQRGRQGDRGEKGDSVKGDPGPRGIAGLPGVHGRDGRDGEDGKDAPFITDVRTEQNKNEVEFIFEFSDGSEIRTDAVKLPGGNTYVAGGGSISGPGSGGEGGAVDSVNGQTGVVVLDKSDIGLSNVDDTSDADKPISDDTQDALDDKIDLTEKGAALGVAELDAGGKVPTAQLPDSILGQLEYQGTWNASTNTPTLTNPDATAHGHYYVASAAGTQFSIVFNIGDWIVNNAGSWEKVDNTDAVSSVFGRSGNVVSVSGDYTASQITNTPAGSIAATTVQAAIDELDSEKAATSHTHAQSDITNLVSDLAARAVRPLGFTIGDGVNVISTGSKFGFWVPYACTISEWKIFGDTAGGSTVLDVKTCDYTTFPTTSSIAGSEKPTLTTAQKNEDVSLSTWSPNIAAGTFVEINVDSNSLHKRVHLSMKAAVT